MEKLFLVDWGEKSNGARYALIKSSHEMIGLHLDSIGNPGEAKYVEVDNADEERFYIELPHIKIEEEVSDGEVFSSIKCEGTYADSYNAKPVLDWKDAG